MENLEWYMLHRCEHAHCPEGCEKPQPSMSDGKMLCMKCKVLFGVDSVMIPCTPETCND